MPEPTDQLLLVVDCKRQRRSVWLTARCAKELGKASNEARSRFAALAKRAVEMGFEVLTDEQFKLEERVPSRKGDGKKIAVWAFKPWAFRIYGTMTDEGGEQKFVGRVGVVKKDNKAKRANIIRAAQLSEE